MTAQSLSEELQFGHDYIRSRWRRYPELEDLLTEVPVVLNRAVLTYDINHQSKRNFRWWFLCMLNNRVSLVVKKHYKELETVHVGKEWLEDLAADQSCPISKFLRHRELNACIQKLPNPYRGVLIDYHLNEMTYRQISEKWQTYPEMVNRVLKKAEQKLKYIIMEHDRMAVLSELSLTGRNPMRTPGVQ